MIVLFFWGLGWLSNSLDFNQSSRYIDKISETLNIHFPPYSGASMALRTSTVYMLVCVLLVCPYPCLARAEEKCCESAENDCDCQDRDACSSADSTETGGNTPANPDCCTQGGTCLCHGAILEHCAHPITSDAGLVAFVPAETALIPGQSYVADMGLLPERAACHFPSAESGRKVCALIESFLI
jgi:hypothetical protein